ncbi:MAG: methylmalonyl Co-A mutase-associated GTPase MeaB [Bdellovibrionales bacterium]|nr:methylmalonyl Co-A mutase-associated GTPase MeaB [Bdellovibrionales bacterium]
MFSDKELVDGILKRNVRAVSRCITLCENRVERAERVLQELPTPEKRSHIIGITGSPGAGKSSLVDRLVQELSSQGNSVAVVAIDPSSPFTGGAVLGDRIRMTNALRHPAVFVRSMATRGALGGVSRGTHDALSILESAGYDYIIVETVGVGQAEIDIVRVADTSLVVLVPGMGDSVQALKAGVLEIADVFAINKSDLPGADILEKDIRVLLSLVEDNAARWEPEVVRTNALDGTGVTDLLASLQKHFDWLLQTPAGLEKRVELTEQRILQMTLDSLREKIETQFKAILQQAARDVFERRLTLGDAVQRLQNELRSKV